ncbi:MAG: LysR substrate-binding domain-containing protein [Thermaerobacter sp.]|nr:LysR substrate-binding domain-containing protein [Thermaerobacter sp.]
MQQLRFFRAVASARTFTEAAEQLGRSQPAVSMQVRALEEEVGLALVEITHRRLQLTPAGRELLSYADQVLEGIENAERAMERIRTGGGPLRIGASATPAIYLLPDRLGPFVRQHPAVSLRLQVGNPAELAEELESGAIDVAVAVGGIDEPPWGPQIETQPLAQDALRVALPPGDPRAGRDLSLEELRAERLILREPDSNTRAIVDRVLGADLQATLEFAASEAVKRAVASGLGVAVLSEMSIRWEIECGRLAQATCSALGGPRQIYAGRRRGRQQLPAEAALWEALKPSGRQV